jgi:hypothetical protein
MPNREITSFYQSNMSVPGSLRHEEQRGTMMSLWYENLSLCLFACGGNIEQRARCIFAYLTMPLPRAWWEEALSTGIISCNYAFILHKLQLQLRNVPHIKKELSFGLLIALAFIDCGTPEEMIRSIGPADNKIGLDDYISKAKQVLAERPELASLGSRVDNERRLSILERVTSLKWNLTNGFEWDSGLQP